MARSGIRTHDQLRNINIITNYLDSPIGSVLIEYGRTKVLCCVSIDENVPKWMKGENQGWVTSEYSMMPYAGGDRRQRESSSGKIGGRTQEIQRLIGRSFRSVFDLESLGERTIWIDCDVLQADGGTRTASITGGFTALMIAVDKLIKEGKIKSNPIKERLAAVSVGMVDGELVLDLDFAEDSKAEVDMNVVMTESGKLIEIQGTAEGKPFSKKKCFELIDLAHSGIKLLLDIQAKALTQANVHFEVK